ncbi:hypothetical protein MYSTI_00008 [Myxococcus stipitatus DSM 14675]|uniref:TPR repeat-containing protein n=1 Tax=Myxococcus stipitatus (strain DSM 14675 / JCM 12634 / Mx s8) TaxID=1278073 RepID=L7U192_MYXSD|nr:hypothetical protein [Myxococcus stipitatus]AGC41367.1 hypothetical protein MYSTI_00008 [Myxococcus stipitatus DSM 14675]
MPSWESEIVRHRRVLSRRRARSVEARASLDSAFAFLRVAFEVYRWHSEASLTTTKAQVLEHLEHFERWRAEFEARFLPVRYRHKSDYLNPDEMHPLGLYVISSQFAWHQYKLPEAGPHLKHSMDLVRSLIPRRPLEERLEEGESTDLYGRLEDPRFHGVNHFYLGELAEQSGAEAEAIRHYLEFIECEPAFSPRNSHRLNRDFYQLSFFFPGTVEALKRVALLFLRSKDPQGRERARSCFEKALELPASHHSPFREYATLLREDGDKTRALHLEEEWRRTLASYPPEISRTWSRHYGVSEA